MKKNVLTLLLALAMLIALTACGGEKETAPEKEETPAEDIVIEPEVVDPEADVPAAPTEEPDVAPEMPTVGEETPEVPPEVEPEPAPEAKPEEKPADKPVEEPKPEQSAPTASVDLVAFYNELYAKLYPLDAEGNATGPFVSDMAEMQEMVDAFYPGLSALSPKQLHIFMPAMSGVPYELVLVEAASADDVEAVKTALQSRIDTEMANHMNYPAVQENWANNSRIVSNGAYVLMAVAADCEAYVEAFNALFA